MFILLDSNIQIHTVALAYRVCVAGVERTQLRRWYVWYVY